MGLTIAVGLFAQNFAEADEEDRLLLEEPFVLLNEILAEHGMAPHCEPEDIQHGDYFEAEMWGYGGLHALRRVAAYVALTNNLPPPSTYDEFHNDPMIQRFEKKYGHYISGSGIVGKFRRWLGGSKMPPFQHLMYHSDAEGFYLPVPFGDVLIDGAVPQRSGLGMLVGSAPTLLKECELLAALMKLPQELDPEGDQLLELIEAGGRGGEPWERLPIEAHSLGNLMAACKASVKTGAALQFC